MYVELRTDDPRAILELLREWIEDGKAALITLKKAGDFHHLSILEAEDEPKPSSLTPVS